jgi:hypothetical protein
MDAVCSMVGDEEVIWERLLESASAAWRLRI